MKKRNIFLFMLACCFTSMQAQRLAVAQKKCTGSINMMWNSDIVNAHAGQCFPVADNPQNKDKNKIFCRNSKGQNIEFSAKNFVIIDIDDFADDALSGNYEDGKGESKISFTLKGDQLVMLFTNQGETQEVPMTPEPDTNSRLYLHGKHPSFGTAMDLNWDSETQTIIMNKKNAFSRKSDNPTPPEYSMVQVVDMRVVRRMKRPDYYANIANASLPTCDFRTLGYVYRKHAAVSMLLNFQQAEDGVNIVLRYAETGADITTQHIPYAKMRDAKIGVSQAGDTIFYSNRIFVAQSPVEESEKIELKGHIPDPPQPQNPFGGGPGGFGGFGGMMPPGRR